MWLMHIGCHWSVRTSSHPIAEFYQISPPQRPPHESSHKERDISQDCQSGCFRRLKYKERRPCRSERRLDRARRLGRTSRVSVGFNRCKSFDERRNSSPNENIERSSSVEERLR